MRSLKPALVVLPRIAVQNANCISSPLTWGFPALTAFAGLCTALERSIGGAKAGVVLKRFGVVCHHFEAQTHSDGYGGHRFNLTRNPVGKNGGSSAIVEEGRAHMLVSLLFDAEIDTEVFLESQDRETLAHRLLEALGGMRIAGGSVLPRLQAPRPREAPKVVLTAGDFDKHWRRIRADLLPGFALISRDDLLRPSPSDDLAQAQSPQAGTAPAEPLQVWLDHIALISRAPEVAKPERDADQPTGKSESSVKSADWSTDKRKGWTVPIPVGYAGIAPLQAPGKVANARDPRLPFQFVECVYSLGEWVSPHRLREPAEFMWQALPPDPSGIYRCVNTNRFSTPSAAPETTCSIS